MQQRGTLCTLARDPAGYPYGSLVLHALDADGHPLLLLSTLAEHTKNLLTDGRGSLLVCDTLPPGGDPLALARATLLGRLARATDEAAPEHYFAAHPATRSYLGMKDFAFYRLTVESLRYIGGYGRMSWVTAEDFAAARPDPLAPSSASILEHMNADHQSALLHYARAHAGIGGAHSSTMTAVDRLGFDMTVVTAQGPRAVRLAFAAPVATPDAARVELVRMAREARERIAASPTAK